MEGLSDFALKSILEEIEERMKEAKTEMDNRTKEYYQGYYEAFFECIEIIKTEKTGDKKPNCQNSAVSFFIISLFDLTQAARL